MGVADKDFSLICIISCRPWGFTIFKKVPFSYENHLSKCYGWDFNKKIGTRSIFVSRPSYTTFTLRCHISRISHWLSFKEYRLTFFVSKFHQNWSSSLDFTSFEVSMAEFSIEIVKESIFKLLTFFNSLSWEHANGLVWNTIWCSFIDLSNHLLFGTNLVSLAQKIAKWENGEKHCSSIFPSKIQKWQKGSFLLKCM